jgi:hypothetical protein
MAADIVDVFATCHEQAVIRKFLPQNVISEWTHHSKIWLLTLTKSLKIQCSLAEAFDKHTSEGVLIVSEDCMQRVSIHRNISWKFKLEKHPDILVGTRTPHTTAAWALVRQSNPLVQEYRSLKIPPLWREKWKDPICEFSHRHYQFWLRFHKDQQFTERLLNSFISGTPVGYRGQRKTMTILKNAASYKQHEQALIKARNKLVEAGKMSGPFAQPILFNTFVSPITVAIKQSTGKVRSCNNMSAPHDSELSVNYNIAKGDIYRIKHVTVSEIRQDLHKMGKNTLTWSLDVVGAYKTRLLPIFDIHLHAEKHPDGYFYSHVSNFGNRSAAEDWELAGSAIQYIVQNASTITDAWSRIDPSHALMPTERPAVQDLIHRYADDFLGATRPARDNSPDYDRAQKQLNSFLAITQTAGPKMGKILKPSLSTTFIGWVFDTREMLVRITPEKKLRCITTMETILKARKVKASQLESLVGVLQYLAAVIPWGKPFLNAMRRLQTSVKNHNHRVRLKARHKKDLAWWIQAIRMFDHAAMWNEASWAHPTECQTDASNQGWGASHERSWNRGDFSLQEKILAIRCGQWKKGVKSRRATDTLDMSQRSMPFLELLAIAKAAQTFAHRWKGKSVIFRTDCTPAMAILNNRYATNPYTNEIVKAMAVLAIQHKCDFRASYLPGVLQLKADPLSRNKMHLFRAQDPLADNLPSIPRSGLCLNWPEQQNC